MSSRIPNTVELLRDAYTALDALPMTWLAEAGHTAIRPAHTAVFEYLDGDGTTVSTLAERARMTKQAMAELVVGLERLGYVTRIPDPTDRRAKLVALTDRGQDVIAVVRVRVPELERRIDDLLGSARARDLRDALDSLRAAAVGWR
jgi:DNA-binding MarR family transcriptional regulator